MQYWVVRAERIQAHLRPILYAVLEVGLPAVVARVVIELALVGIPAPFIPVLALYRFKI